jgi:hypothetical protein
MNVVKAIRDYITKMVRAAPGMKVLLMDQETVWLFLHLGEVVGVTRDLEGGSVFQPE